MATNLTEDIELVRKQIRTLTHRRQCLTSSLLSSTRIQKRLNNHHPTKSTSRSKAIFHIAASTKSAETALTNLHRLTSTATTFPFTDPSPSPSPLQLLGVRIDICDPLSGRYAAPSPYYLLLRRNSHGRLSIYRHTIPAFVDVRELETAFLGQLASADNEESESESETDRGRRAGENNPQDLHGLVRHVRKSLAAWTLRRASIKKIQQELNLPSFAPSDAQDPSNNDSTHPSTPNQNHQSHTHNHGITSLSPTALDSRSISITWADGRVARIRVTDSGKMEDCVVLQGGDGGGEARLRAIERALMAEGAWVEGLRGRLEGLAR